jgi:hypothetical protein
MMSAADQVDRKRVREFFAWSFDGKALLKWGVMSGIGGVLAMFGEAYLLGLASLALGGFLLWFRSYKKNGFGRLHEAVKTAKSNDFARVLRRSYDKIDTDVASLLTFDNGIHLAELSRTATSDAELFAALMKKAVFMFGKPPLERVERSKLFQLNGKLVEEYSPIDAIILYLTSSELITYSAGLDICAGDLKAETIRRLNLRDIVEIQTTTDTHRFRRGDWPLLFKEYEKATKTTLQADIVQRSYAIQLTRMDGRTSILPVGVDAYTNGEKGVLDGGQTDDGRLERFAAEIVKRIKDAKSATGARGASAGGRAPSTAGDWS